MPEGIARICNAAIGPKARFRVPKSLWRRTRGRAGAGQAAANTGPGAITAGCFGADVCPSSGPAGNKRGARKSRKVDDAPAQRRAHGFQPLVELAPQGNRLAGIGERGFEFVDANLGAVGGA